MSLDDEKGCRPCEIKLAFDTLDDANFIKDQIEATIAQQEELKKRIAGRLTPESNSDSPRHLVVELSQSGFVDISDNQTNQGGTASQHALAASHNFAVDGSRWYGLPHPLSSHHDGQRSSEI